MLKLRGHNGPVRAMTFSPDSRRIASVAKRDRHASLWQLSGECEISPGDGDEIQDLCFAPDGSAVVLASGRYLSRWDFATRVMEPRWRRGANYCWQVAYSPDGSTVVASCYNRQGEADCFRTDVFRLDTPNKKTFMVGDYGTPRCLVYSRSGRLLASGGDHKKIRVWSMREKAKALSWGCGAKVHAVAFSGDEATLAAAVGDKLLLYDVASRKPCGELTGHAGPVRALSSAPDGTVLSAGADGTARLWDVDSRQERKCFDWKVGELSAAAFSSDGALAAVGADGGLVVWDME